MSDLRTFAIMYSYVPDILDRRQPHRAGHLERLRQLEVDGRMVIAGAFSDPTDGALIVIQAPEIGDVYGWIAGDPYVKAGLVTGASIRELTVAVRA